MRLMEQIFDRLGRSIARRPWPYIIVPVIITFFCSFGLIRMRFEDDVWDIYSPLDAISRVEEKNIMPFEHASGLNHYRMTIIVDRIDHGNLLNVPDLEEIDRLNRFIMRNHTILRGGNPYHYRDICGVYCNDSNAALIGFLIGVAKKERGGLIFTFPKASALQQEFFIGHSIGDFRRNDRNVIDDFRLLFLYYAVETRTPQGKDIARQFEKDLQGIFKRASESSLTLNFAMMSKNRELEEQRDMLLTAIPYLFITIIVLLCFSVGTLINFPLRNSQHIEAAFSLVTPGMAIITSIGFLFLLGFPFSNILIVVPFLTLCIGIDDAFLILAAWRQSDPDADLEDKMGETMAKSSASVSVTSFTDVLCFAVGFCSQLPVVQLFCMYTALCLAIDYIYQITTFAAVVALCGKRQLRLRDEQKLENFMTRAASETQVEQTRIHRKRSSADSGVVVVYHTAKRDEPSKIDKKQDINKNGEAITRKRAKTNSDLSFSSLFPVAKVAPFQGSATSIICGQSMDDVRNNYSHSDLSSTMTGNSAKSSICAFTSLPRSTEPSIKTMFRNQNILITYVRFLKWRSVRVIVLGLFGVHVIVSMFFCAKVNNNFTLENLYLRSSPLTPVSSKYEKYVLHEAYVVNFALTTMPNFVDLTVRQRFFEMIKEFENIPKFGMGSSVGTQLWMRDFDSAIAFWGGDNEFWEPDFLLKHFHEYHMEEKYIRTEENGGKARITGFYWTIAYHNMSNYRDVESLLKQRRLIHKKYAQIFNVSSSHILEKVPVESAAATPANFMQTAGQAIVLMGVLLSFFCADFAAIFSVTVSICSICLGTVAYLHAWGVHLDGISLISILMSIGFSVDYSAHICYHFFAHKYHTEQHGNDGGEKNEKIENTAKFELDRGVRLENTFTTVGWPVIQGALTTVLGIVPLTLVDAYVVAVFWKTVIIVTVLGMVHALVILPCVFLTVTRQASGQRVR